jgi:hypothetical protein
MHGFKDFLLHLFTITIGLLIALSLEGWVESRHHHQLAHQAEDGLRAEIANNAAQIGPIRQQIEDHQKELDANLDALGVMQAHRHATSSRKISIGLRIFDDISWKTAQSTGAMSYISYKDAQTFSDIYLEQDEYFKMRQLSVEDTGKCISLLISRPDDWVPSPAQIDVLADRFGKAKFDLMMLSIRVEELDKTYQKFESEHAGPTT